MTDTPLPDPRPLDARHLRSIRPGPAQTYRHIAVHPLHSQDNGGPDYLALDEALNGRHLAVAELSKAGSVPELRVVNTGPSAVLLLDGEELAGAKQNRVLNTSILIRGHSEVVIPVSCTEQGRWSETTSPFSSSGVVMNLKTRAHKSKSVSESLQECAGFRSDQASVWNLIEALHSEAQTDSPTSAMLDAFTARDADLAAALGQFPRLDDQHGLLVVVNGRVVGMDWVSRASAYACLHTKLLKSYVFDGLLEHARDAVPASESMVPVEAFLRGVGALAGRPFPSVGLGWDWRFNAVDTVGSALIHNDQAVHLGFFNIETAPTQPPLARLRARRRWHME